METTKDRILLFLKEKGISQRKFEMSIEVSNGYLNNLKSSPSSKVVQSIFCKYPELNTVWLLTGEGDMLKSSSTSVSGKTSSSTSSKVIRYWSDMDATAGGVESFDDYKKQWIPISIPDFNDCTDAINVFGDSMAPLYKNGHIVIIREWKENFIDFGNVYLIITVNGHRMIKYIRAGKDAEHISCESENPLFPPFEVEKKDILRLYVVKGSITRNLL